MKISVLMPSIRFELLENMYKSIESSFTLDQWELVIVSPYPLPDALKSKTNIIYIEDHGNPIRCRQRGLLACTGDYICYAADDVLFYPASLNLAYLTAIEGDYKRVIAGKYLEGSENNPEMRGDQYYNLNYHGLLQPIMKKFPAGYKLLNTGLISRKLMLEIGGWDCQFEACAMACVDLSIRLQTYGAEVILQNQPIFKSTHLYERSGDHQPIHDAQVSHDQPLFLSIYNDPSSINRTVIPLDTWEKTPSHWDRRFGPKNA